MHAVFHYNNTKYLSLRNAQFTPPARQDKTVLSVSYQAGVNCPPDKYVLRRSASSGRTALPDTLRHRPDTERTCLAVGPTQFTPPSHQTRHRHEHTTKQSCLCRVWRGSVDWTIPINVFRLQIFCRRQSCVVGNPVHAAEADATQTRQFVVSGVAV